MDFGYFNERIVKNAVPNRKVNMGKVIRLVTISDLHDYTDDAEKTEGLAEAIRGQYPDFIFIAGDIFKEGASWDGLDEKLKRFRNFVSAISETAPVFISWGNTDIKGTNEKNIQERIKNFRRLERERPGMIYPLYNDRVVMNGFEFVGYTPSYELMGGLKGLASQIHGYAHDKFIEEYEKNGVKFQSNPKTIKVFVGHDPHLIATAENEIGLESLKTCDIFITGHLLNGLEAEFKLLNKLSRKLTRHDSRLFDYDHGLTKRFTIYNKDGKLKGLSPGFGRTNLCRGIFYIDDDSRCTIWQSPYSYNGESFYENLAMGKNHYVWFPIKTEEAVKKITNDLLHMLLVSEGISAGFKPDDRRATINNTILENPKDFHGYRYY